MVYRKKQYRKFSKKVAWSSLLLGSRTKSSRDIVVEKRM
jgi:hypothetical protein